MEKKSRAKELLFTEKTYVSTGYPSAIKSNSGYFKSVEIISAMGGKVTFCLVPSTESLDRILIYLSATDAYRLGKLLINRAKAASQELLELNLERR